MREELELRAQKNGRSLNAEIILRLEKTMKLDDLNAEIQEAKAEEQAKEALRNALKKELAILRESFMHNRDSTEAIKQIAEDLRELRSKMDTAGLGLSDANTLHAEPDDPENDQHDTPPKRKVRIRKKAEGDDPWWYESKE